MIVLLTLLALANDVAPEEPTEPAETLETAAPTDELLRQARSRIESGDYEGAKLVLGEVREREGDDHEEANYLLAATLELEGDTRGAWATYERMLARWPEGARVDDIRFRQAEVLASEGRFADALAHLDGLEPMERFPERDQLKVELWRGIWLIDLGDVRRGEKRLLRALRDAPADLSTFYQAKAHARLAGLYTDRARGYGFDGKPRKVARNFRNRQRLVNLADEHLGQVVELKEPEWILEGLLVLGQSLEDVGSDLLSSPDPIKKLTEQQLALYRDNKAKETEQFWLKAQLYYRTGVDMALKLRFESSRVARLQARHDALTARIEGL